MRQGRKKFKKTKHLIFFLIFSWSSLLWEENKISHINCEEMVKSSQLDTLTQSCKEWLIIHPTTSFPTDATSQANRYFHVKRSDKLYYLMPPVFTFTTRTRHATFTESKQPHFHQILIIRRKFYSDIFLPRSSLFWKRLPRTCFPEHFSLNINQGSNIFFIHIIFIIYIFLLHWYHTSHSVILYFEWLLSLVVDEH